MVCGATNAVNISIVGASKILGNVYYIHASNGHSSVVVKSILNHSNYHTWARSMRRELGGKN